MMKKMLLVLVVVSALKLNGQTHDSITIAAEPGYDSVNGLHRFLFGNNYRKIWAVPVTIRVVHIATEKGGLTPCRTWRWSANKIT